MSCCNLNNWVIVLIKYHGESHVLWIAQLYIHVQAKVFNRSHYTFSKFCHIFLAFLGFSTDDVIAGYCYQWSKHVLYSHSCCVCLLVQFFNKDWEFSNVVGNFQRWLGVLHQVLQFINHYFIHKLFCFWFHYWAYLGYWNSSCLRIRANLEGTEPLSDLVNDYIYRGVRGQIFLQLS